MILKFVHQPNVINCLKYCTKSASAKNKLYSSTVLLPKTRFPLKLENQKLVERDENITSVAQFEELYKWQESHLSEPEFILHDGPPYANGMLHMGHAINKILKDAILRHKIINGIKVNYIPGWDCHGLPIELKAVKNSDTENPIKIRNKARDFASKTIQKQMEIFKSWGVVGDWNNYYATYTPDYIKNQFRIFHKLYFKGLVYRDIKPIHWSPSSRTALAEAELEYNEKHISPSAYVRLKINKFPAYDFLQNKNIYALIWTTTPWTLPANQAVCYNKDLSYAFIKKPDPLDKDVYIVATELIDQISKTTNCNYEILGVLEGGTLSNTTYNHPIYKDQICPFLQAPHATASKGTGLVHTAPAHGPEDFLVALENKIKIVDLVDELGCFRPEAGNNLKGKQVLQEGTKSVLDLIKNDLIHLTEITHSYPYDWRTKEPVILRASKQWFIDTNAIKDRAIELLESVEIIPKTSGENYKKNLINQVRKRPYWCISRQRKWGVPIPVFFDKNSSLQIINEDIIRHQCELIDTHGTDYWWKLSLDQLLPPHLHQYKNIEDIEQSQDIMDIWFDSGVSWSKVLGGRKVADMYLEGLDQFNGWFQSSLITSVAFRDKLPYKSIYVHGFAVDQNGNKMSKSLGNVIDPLDIVKGCKGKKPYGIDTLRWWVVCHAFRDSLAPVNENVLQSSSDEVQKVRSTLRFALASSADFIDSDMDYKNFELIDKYILHLLYKFQTEVQECFENYQFNKVCTLVLSFATNEISALYYTAVKDRLYCELVDSSSRKAAQFVLKHIFEVLTKSISPIVPHLVEEMFLYLPHEENQTYFTSPHLTASKDWENLNVEKAMNVVLNIKKAINKSAGAETLDKEIKIKLNKRVLKSFCDLISLEELEHQMEDIFQVSKVMIEKGAEVNEEFQVEVEKSGKYCCLRCRKINCQKVDDLCGRCTFIVNKLNNKEAVMN